MKICKRCSREQPLDSFSIHSGFKDGKNSVCRECKNEEARTHYKNNPRHQEWTVERRLQKYGLTIQEYEELLTQQEGKCAVCQKEKQLVIDHDHTTGNVRGLLCTSCNTGIGKLGDSVEGLQAALRYLEPLT